MISNMILPAVAVLAGVAKAQVTATGTMGTTNPPQATMGTTINQNSMSRLLSLNAIDDFCLFAPPVAGDTIGDTEEEEVAWCVQPRNDARVIPDGTFTSVHFVKTPLYWQVQGMGDFTRINVLANDYGGELDPHGATGNGNPVGGNVTANATGSDVHYEEWMNYMAYNEFCLRICIAENSTVSAAIQCQHTLDLMGCEFVMPGDYTDDSFTECDGDSAYPPGLYPLANGSTSTFAQRYTGTYTDGAGKVQYWTQGDLSTPSSAYSIPATSNCISYTSISNGIPLQQLGVTNSGSRVTASAGTGAVVPVASQSGSMASSMSSNSTKATSASSSNSNKAAAAASSTGSATNSGASSTGSAKSAAGQTASFGPVAAMGASLVAVVAGAAALLI